MRKPYFVKRLKCWYFKDKNRREIRLDEDEAKAFEIWQECLNAQKYRGEDATVVGLIENFFEAKKASFSQTRYQRLVQYGNYFTAEYGHYLVSDITQSLVQEWLLAPKPGREKSDGSRSEIRWLPNSQRHPAALLKRIWKWAHNNGYIRVNSLAELALPEPEYRTSVIDESVHQQLVLHCLKLDESKPFALYLIASRCGARPQQIRDVTAQHVTRDGSCWVFQKHKTRGKTKRPLVVYLSPCLQTLTKILTAARPTGNLFLNSQGNMWKKDTVTQRMERLRIRLKLPDGTVAYLYRHTMITDAMIAGHSTAVVAQLAGHTDTRMVSQVYGHLGEHKQFMLDAMAKIRKKD